nr:unnamed protein product [Callosobruchus analis]
MVRRENFVLVRNLIHGNLGPMPEVKTPADIERAARHLEEGINAALTEATTLEDINAPNRFRDIPENISRMITERNRTRRQVQTTLSPADRAELRRVLTEEDALRCRKESTREMWTINSSIRRPFSTPAGTYLSATAKKPLSLMNTQYIKSKPVRYGIKIWSAADTKTSYLCNIRVYTPGGKAEKNQGFRAVCELAQPYYKKDLCCRTTPSKYSKIEISPETLGVRRSGVEYPDIVKVRAGAIGECLGPALSDDRYFPRDVAVARIRSVGTWLRHNRNNIGDLTMATENNYDQTLAFVTNSTNNMGFETIQLLNVFPLIPAAGDDVTLQEAILLITHAANHATEWITNYPLSSLLHLHIAIAKQGNVTTRFVSKVRQGVSTDLQVQVDISPALITMFWNTFRNGINDANVQELFRQWEAWIPSMALRMRLIVQQTVLTGLTVLACIGRAMKLHPSFKWADVGALLPMEMTAYKDAVTAVGGNSYYGYKKDLGKVASTHYKSIGYVAWQLLSRASGINTLNSYKGWPRNIPSKNIIDAMIDRYIEGRETETISAEAQTDAERIFNEIKAVINDPANTVVYA